MLGDGCAITTDALIESVHFDTRNAPEDVGFKALAVSVSDLAAMGADPSWATLSLSLPPGRAEWVTRFARGLHAACQTWGVSLIGGDTTGSPGPICISLTLGGYCVGAPLTRDGAHPDDDLWVTGTLGLAGAGWRIAQPPDAAHRAWSRPSPPLAFALALAKAQLATAAMDLSDGLAKDLPRLCAASSLGARVRRATLPAHPALPEPRLDHQLFGGEDYQLLFAGRPEQRPAIEALANAHHVRVTRIGTLLTAASIRLDDDVWPVGGFDHFAPAKPQVHS